MTEEEKKAFYEGEEARVIQLKDGREFGVTMTRWHWEAMDWIVDVPGVSKKEMIETALEFDEGDGLDHNLMAYVEYFFDRWCAAEEAA